MKNNSYLIEKAKEGIVFGWASKIERAKNYYLRFLMIT